MSEDFRELSVVNGRRIRGELTRTLVMSLLIGLLLGALGPFGTFERLPIIERFSFWLACIFGGALIQAPLYWLGDWVGRARHIPAWIWAPATAALAAVPITILVNGVAVTLLRTTVTDTFTELYPLVLVITLPIQIISHVLAGQRAHRAARANPPAPAAPTTAPGLDLPGAAAPAPGALSSFFDRVPKRLGRDLICLRMEDHYLRVYTSAGNALILMKISDAEAELTAIEGLRLHRSWWVARSAVTGWRRDGKNLELILRNGLTAPVARERQAKVRAAGWLS
ncbi:MAG: LytTR family DNA-binding domain-containing protein [Caulobacterales bacterium]